MSDHNNVPSGGEAPARAVGGVSLACLLLASLLGALATRDLKGADKAEPAGVAKGKQERVLQYEGRNGNFALYLVPDVWRKLDKPVNPVAEVQFARKAGDAGALVIAERIMVPVETLKKRAFAHIRDLDRDATIINEEKKMVRGKEGLCATINAKVSGIPFTYYVYYYSGNEGTFQVMTWTGQNLFEELKPELEAFVDGFRVIPKQNKKPGNLKSAGANGIVLPRQ